MSSDNSGGNASANTNTNTVMDRRRRAFSSHVTLRKLEVYCNIAKFSNVTRAAERLGIAQPAVTAHLRGLEDKLDAKLVRKVGRNIELTEVGESVYRWASDMIARSSEMVREVSGIEEGVIGRAFLASSMVVGTYVLPDIIIEFQKTHPGASISTSISNPRIANESVRTGDCDFAVTILDTNQNTNDLLLEYLWKEPLRLVTAADSSLVGKTATVEQLMTLPYVTSPQGQIARDAEDEVLRAAGIVQRNVVLEFGHPEPILRAVHEGVGVSFSHESALRDDLNKFDLRIVDTPGVEIGIPLYLIYHRDKILTQLQQRLLEDIRAAFLSKRLDSAATWRRPTKHGSSVDE